MLERAFSEGRAERTNNSSMAFSGLLKEMHQKTKLVPCFWRTYLAYPFKELAGNPRIDYLITCPVCHSDLISIFNMDIKLEEDKNNYYVTNYFMFAYYNNKINVILLNKKEANSLWLLIRSLFSSVNEMFSNVIDKFVVWDGESFRLGGSSEKLKITSNFSVSGLLINWILGKIPFMSSLGELEFYPLLYDLPNGVKGYFIPAYFHHTPSIPLSGVTTIFSFYDRYGVNAEGIEMIASKIKMS